MSGKLLAGVCQTSVRGASVSQKENKGDGGDFNQVLGEAVSAQENTAGTPKSGPVGSDAKDDAGDDARDGGQRNGTGEKNESAGVLLAQAVLAAGLMHSVVSAAAAQAKPAAGQAAETAALQTEAPAGKPAAGLAPAIAPIGGNGIGNDGENPAAETAPLLFAADRAAPAAAAHRTDKTQAAPPAVGPVPTADLPETGGAPAAVRSSGPAALPQSDQNTAALRLAVTAHAAAGNTRQAAETEEGGAVAETAGVSSGHEPARPQAQSQPQSADAGGQAAGQPTPWAVPVQTAVRAGDVSSAVRTEPHAAVQNVARQIAAAANDPAAGRTGQLRLHLSPADLGGINLHFATENGRVTLQITADSSRTGALLTAHLDELDHSLAHSGVTMDRTEVFCQTGTGSQTGGRSDGAPPGFGGQTGGHRNARQNAAAFSAPSVSADIRPAAESVSETPSGVSPGTMSIFA